MTGMSRMENAAEQLRSAYGTPVLFETADHWSHFLKVLLVGSAPDTMAGHLTEALGSAPFNSPQALAQASTGLLVELLSSVPRGPQKAGLLKLVANWWLAEFGDLTTVEWSRDLQFYRESLRKIRGLGPATVDELLLFAARLPVFPLDRGSLRVAIRHGWLDFPIEDGEAQAVFVRGMADSSIDSRQFSVLLARVADAHCGREPKCDGCPLQSLLPAGGPLNPDSC